MEKFTIKFDGETFLETTSKEVAKMAIDEVVMKVMKFANQPTCMVATVEEGNLVSGFELTYRPFTYKKNA